MWMGTRFDKGVLLSRRSALVIVGLLLLLQWPCASKVYALEPSPKGGSMAHRIAQNESIEELQRRRTKQQQDAEEKMRRIERLEKRIWVEFEDFGVRLMEGYLAKGLKVKPISNWQEAVSARWLGFAGPGKLVRSVRGQQILVISLNPLLLDQVEAGRVVVMGPEGITDTDGKQTVIGIGLLTHPTPGKWLVGSDGSCEVLVLVNLLYEAQEVRLSYKFPCDTNIFEAKRAEISAAFDRSLRAILKGPGAEDSRPQTTAATPPSKTEQSKTGVSSSLRDVLRQINQADKARIAHYPTNVQRSIAQRSVAGSRAMREEKWERARDEYGEVVRYDPENFQANVDLSGAYAMLKDAGNAKKYFDVATRRAPQYPVPYINMVYAYARTGNFDEAVKYLEKAAALGYKDLAKLATDNDLPAEFRQQGRVQQLLTKK